MRLRPWAKEKGRHYFRRTPHRNEGGVLGGEFKKRNPTTFPEETGVSSQEKSVDLLKEVVVYKKGIGVHEINLKPSPSRKRKMERVGGDILL